ncbi:YciI family protein [Phenylobacterium soli]|uniref:YciI family protein n=1 Tax=Phenylobacterium soli TaxID=2170551 RepID=A0A328AG11_9CAUL|nr:YciI family protein [Phenylobacterium soli]RAK53457.1 YciI family protein [Phenylobacterium soli]
MPLFALSCIDKPNSLEVRMGARQDHLAWVGGTGMLKLGGPYLDEKGDMAGSLMIIEAEDLAAAKAFNANDPYTKAGLWQSVDIRPFRTTFGQI